MSPDPEDTDTSDGRTYTFETKLDRGDHTYYFTGRDALNQDAIGPSAGEDNAASTPDVSKKKTESTPGMTGILILAAVVCALAATVVSRRRVGP